ncbi:hypothetical protein BS47DRAFT_1303052, partial [Hydnum rufescens UP504]
NGCRKQKMRCEGADNPPCKRYAVRLLSCLFEKPVRDTSANEQGLERIRSLETAVSNIQSTLNELVSSMHSNQSQPSPRSAASPSSSNHPNHSSPRALSTSENGLSHGVHYNQAYGPMPTSSPTPFPPGQGQMMPPSLPQNSTPLPSFASIQQGIPPPFPAPVGHRPPSTHPPHPTQPLHRPTSQPTGPPHRTRFSNVALDPALSGPSGSQYSTNRQVSALPHHSMLPGTTAVGHLRPLPVPSSNVTSVDSSEDEGELPTSGLTAPISVLRNLAERADRGETGSTERTRSPSPDATGNGRDRPQGGRPPKRRKTRHLHPVVSQVQVYPDVVTRDIITEKEARELFEIFYRGCSTFLPVFDSRVDTFDVLHRRSPFCVNAICLVATKVRDAGGPRGPTYQKLLDEVQAIACATLFSPVTRQEAIQATIIIAGWSDDGGWLSLGHAVRMAFEISMHKTWPKLLRRIKTRKTRGDSDERELVISTRTWFCLYIFEHQLSFGTGRPAILHEDESIKECRAFLDHPLTIPDDIRLVSMVELAIIRERLHHSLSSTSAGATSASSDVYAILNRAKEEFQGWFQSWDDEFSRRQVEPGYQNFQRESLEVQRYFAELFHNATALRGIRGPDDVSEMPAEQRALALHSIQIAKAGLRLCLHTQAYKDGLRYAVHFTHVSATFAASFLIRLARLFPSDVDLRSIMIDVEELATELSRIPATRYARTLRLMLQRARQRRVLPPRSHQSDNHSNGGEVPSQDQPIAHIETHMRTPSDASRTVTSPTISYRGRPTTIPDIHPGPPLQ